MSCTYNFHTFYETFLFTWWKKAKLTIIITEKKRHIPHFKITHICFGNTKIELIIYILNYVRKNTSFSCAWSCVIHRCQCLALPRQECNVGNVTKCCQMSVKRCIDSWLCVLIYDYMTWSTSVVHLLFPYLLQLRQKKTKIRAIDHHVLIIWLLHLIKMYHESLVQSRKP